MQQPSDHTTPGGHSDHIAHTQLYQQQQPPQQQPQPQPQQQFQQTPLYHGYPATPVVMQPMEALYIQKQMYQHQPQSFEFPQYVDASTYIQQQPIQFSPSTTQIAQFAPPQQPFLQQSMIQQPNPYLQVIQQAPHRHQQPQWDSPGFIPHHGGNVLMEHPSQQYGTAANNNHNSHFSPQQQLYDNSQNTTAHRSSHPPFTSNNPNNNHNNTPHNQTNASKPNQHQYNDSSSSNLPVIHNIVNSPIPFYNHVKFNSDNTIPIALSSLAHLIYPKSTLVVNSKEQQQQQNNRNNHHNNRNNNNNNPIPAPFSMKYGVLDIANLYQEVKTDSNTGQKTVTSHLHYNFKLLLYCFSHEPVSSATYHPPTALRYNEVLKSHEGKYKLRMTDFTKTIYFIYNSSEDSDKLLLPPENSLVAITINCTAPLSTTLNNANVLNVELVETGLNYNTALKYLYNYFLVCMQFYYSFCYVKPYSNMVTNLLQQQQYQQQQTNQPSQMTNTIPNHLKDITYYKLSQYNPYEIIPIRLYDCYMKLKLLPIQLSGSGGGANNGHNPKFFNILTYNSQHRITDRLVSCIAFVKEAPQPCSCCEFVKHCYEISLIDISYDKVNMTHLDSSTTAAKKAPSDAILQLTLDNSASSFSVHCNNNSSQALFPPKNDDLTGIACFEGSDCHDMNVPSVKATTQHHDKQIVTPNEEKHRSVIKVCFPSALQLGPGALPQVGSVIQVMLRPYTSPNTANTFSKNKNDKYNTYNDHQNSDGISNMLVNYCVTNWSLLLHPEDHYAKNKNHKSFHYEREMAHIIINHNENTAAWLNKYSDIVRYATNDDNYVVKHSAPSSAEAVLHSTTNTNHPSAKHTTQRRTASTSNSGPSSSNNEDIDLLNSTLPYPQIDSETRYNAVFPSNNPHRETYLDDFFPLPSPSSTVTQESLANRAIINKICHTMKITMFNTSYTPHSSSNNPDTAKNNTMIHDNQNNNSNNNQKEVSNNCTNTNNTGVKRGLIDPQASELQSSPQSTHRSDLPSSSSPLSPISASPSHNHKRQRFNSNNNNENDNSLNNPNTIVSLLSPGQLLITTNSNNSNINHSINNNSNSNNNTPFLIHHQHDEKNKHAITHPDDSSNASMDETHIRLKLIELEEQKLRLQLKIKEKK